MQHLFSNRGIIDNDSSMPSSGKDDVTKKLIESGLKTLTFVGSSGMILGISSTALADPASPSDLKPITIIGSGGKTGKLIKDTLTSKGYAIRPTYRELGKKTEENAASADVKDVESLMKAVEGSSVVIFAASASRKGGDAKAVDYQGVENIARACVARNVPRLVVISSAAVTKPDSLGFKITNIFGRIMEYKILGEDALRAVYKTAEKGLSYVIVRPGGLADGAAEGVQAIEINQGDNFAGEINRADVAEAVAAAAISRSIPNAVTFEVYQANRSGPLEGDGNAKSGYQRTGSVLGSYEKMFEGLKTDSELTKS
eukprot:CAMPEP_0182420152 /NCGR_PEP_ID=MMETSP1167-20130531/4720_1 /TAXON_ID=2988 /ORGANISM="Mallomonas Sp, Strain CCMP3275" /LENGTH=313 /DNA_ID=CAMNT_0024595685 /DNA_START=153 /DNA_END=1091 /DNA_ORIENTATION=-